MKRLLIAAGVLALAAAMCIPISVFSDGSDAFDITESENGISWESDTLNEEQVNKLYSEAQLEDLAEEAMDLLFASTSSFTASNVKVTEAKVKESQGLKVTANDRTEVRDSSVRCKLTFRATANSAGNNIFSNAPGGADLMKYVKFDNRTVAGMYFDIDAEFELTASGKDVQEFVQNKAGNYVVVKENRDSMEYRSLSGDVKCVYNDGTADVTKEFTVDFSTKFGNKDAHATFEFNGEPADAVMGDRVLCGDQGTGDVWYVFKYEYKADGSNGGGTYDLSDIWEVEVGSSYTNVTILDAPALAPVTYEFYDTGGTATPLFYSVNDPALASNDALKAYLNEHGSTGETFSAAEDLADSEYGSAKKSHTLLYVGIGVAVVAVVGVAAFVILRMRQ